MRLSRAGREAQREVHGAEPHPGRGQRDQPYQSEPGPRHNSVSDQSQTQDYSCDSRLKMSEPRDVALSSIVVHELYYSPGPTASSMGV